MAELDRCPSCGAGVVPGADWCSLCYADLRPRAEEPAPEPVETPAEPVATPATEVEAPAAEVEVPVEAPAPDEPTAAASDVDSMLAALAAEESARTPGVLGRFSSRGTRVGVMLLGSLGLALVLLLVIWVLGVLL